MKIFRTLLTKAAIVTALFLLNLPFGNAQSVFLQNAQTVFDFGDYEINYTLLQKYDNNYVCLPSYGTAPIGSSAYWLAILETDRDFLPVNTRLLLLDQSIRDSIETMIAYDAVQSNDSSIWACGVVTFSDPQIPDEGFIIKLDSYGNPQWLKFYPPTREFRSIVQTRDNNFAVCGYLNQHQDSLNRGVILKVNTSGNILWDRIYYSADYDTISGHTNLNQVISFGDTLMAVGTTNDQLTISYQSDILCVKLTQYGDPVRHLGYERAYDSTSTSLVEFGKTIKYRDFNVWLAGNLINSDVLANKQDIFIMRIDVNSMYPVWSNKYSIGCDTSYTSGEFAERFVLDCDSLQIVGYAKNDIFNSVLNDNALWLCTDYQGNSPTFHLFGDSIDDKFFKGLTNSDDYITMAGYSNSFNSNLNDDVYLVEKYPFIEQLCHDSITDVCKQVIAFGAYRAEVDSVEIESNPVDIYLSEIRVHFDTICIKKQTNKELAPKATNKPSQGVYVLDPSGSYILPATAKEYYVISLTGAVLQYGTVGNGYLNLSSLVPGMYFLRVITKSGEVINSRVLR